MDGRGIAHTVGVNHGESADRRSSIASPGSTRACTATLARGVPASTNVMIGLDPIEQNADDAHLCLPNEPQLMDITALSDGFGSPIPATQWNTVVPAAEQGHTNFGVTAQLQADNLPQHSLQPMSQFGQFSPQAKIMHGGIRQSQQLPDLNMLRDPKPAYQRHSYREEIEARNGGISPDDLLLTTPLAKIRCLVRICDRVFDDEEEADDHFQLDHNYPENCVCRICRDAFSSSFEKGLHDYYHHRHEVCRFSV
ncbi:uncharacterized protein BO87DRAFT_389159 [Aspergillus neoniger CBS 115656]|uniref:C2H2-type domain-containing protein n=1 Tax=Aspergillus neoniger (strain CBS 115656) TaxID=1448310 RepID=A0A318YB67_ASPNB|nr:hypothetical protein BO87DRAFT_389159 [Aspergillus neoniger CBS 115656]PYH31591.1 hypothetical protein BO87DRAFT_389159 [Aspergillus neoniger CBS 115656]